MFFALLTAKRVLRYRLRANKNSKYKEKKLWQRKNKKKDAG